MTTCLLACFLTATLPMVDSISFAQCDIAFDGSQQQNSNWGYAQLNYTGIQQDMYLNVNVDGRWEIENALVTSSKGIGLQQQEGWHFNLGNPDGMNVTGVMYGATLTPDVVVSPPPITQFGGVGNKLEGVYSTNSAFPIFHTPPGKFKGRKKKDPLPPGAEGEIAGVPNQPCGKAECVPTAISNLMKWLKSKFPGMKTPDAAITIQAVAAGIEWAPGGGAETEEWRKKKEKYLKSLGDKITTAGKNQSEGSVDEMITALMGQQSVIEMQVGDQTEKGGHCVAVTSMVKLEGGLCKVTFNHDPAQNNTPGDVKTENITFEMSTGKITDGPPWAKDKFIHGFVMQTYFPPKKK